jgi:threonine synthase
MKGTVRIDLFDVNGKLMQTSESENLVTDLADDCINGIASLFKNSSASVVRACAATGLTNIPSTMAGGVLLFDSAFANTTDNQATIKTPVGYAGSLYAGDDVKAGFAQHNGKRRG